MQSFEEIECSQSKNLQLLKKEVARLTAEIETMKDKYNEIIIKYNEVIRDINKNK